MPTVIQDRNVSASIRSLSNLETFDYLDVFTAATSGEHERSPEYWARALEDAAGIGGQFVWRVVLGLRLAWRASPDHIGGWRVAGRGEDWITLEAASWFMTANIALYVEEDRLSAATIIRYDRPVAAWTWRLVSILHRHAMPGLLRHAWRSQSSPEKGSRKRGVVA